MPFKSEKQRKKLWRDEPEVARKWTKKYGSKPAKPKKGVKYKKPTKKQVAARKRRAKKKR